MKRQAFVCLHKDHEKEGVTPRVFIRPGESPPRCPRHGRMTPQANKPYRGSRA